MTPLGALIGRGRTADVHAWDDGWAIKLFHAGVPEHWARREAELTRRAHDLGLAAPATGDCRQIDGRWGIVYERLDGPTMMHASEHQPWQVWSHAHMLADLQVALHRQRCPEMRSQRESLERGICSAPLLSDRCRQALLQSLATLPDGDAICHGDLHPDNVILSARGPILIDWLTAKRGHPLADVARTVLLLRCGTLPHELSWALRVTIQAMRRVYLDAYLQRYRQALAAARGDLACWLPIVAAARLNERLSASEDQQLLNIIAQWWATQH